MVNTYEIAVPEQYIDTAMRVVRSLLNGNCDLEAVGNNIIISCYHNIDVESWRDYLVESLPAIEASLRNQDGQRDANRCYQHVISDEEFILLLKCNGEQDYLDMAVILDKRSENNQHEALMTLLQGNREKGYDVDLAYFISQLFLPIETRYIQIRDNKVDLIYGDVVRHEFMTYRNDGVYIYNSYQLTELAYDPDDYGTVPRTFPVITEFPIMYWSDAIAHGRFVFVPKAINCQSIDYDYQMGRNASCDVAADEAAMELGQLPDNSRIAVMTVVANYSQPNKFTGSNLNVVFNYVLIYYDTRQQLDNLLDTIASTGTYFDYSTHDSVYHDVRDYSNNGMPTVAN